MSDFGSAVSCAALAGHIDHRQRVRIHWDGLGCLGRAARYALPLHSTGKPVQNVFIRSFNRKFREECREGHWFRTLQKTQLVIEAWRQEYEERTRSTVGDVTLKEFIHYHHNGDHLTQEITFSALV